MKTRVDARFLEEAARFRLSFRCEACAHFAPDTGACGNGYPNAAHRELALGAEHSEIRELVFCKEFELS